MDLDTVDDNFSFGMPPPNRDGSKVKLFVLLDDPKTKGETIKPDYLVGTAFTTRLQLKMQETPRHILFILKTKVTVVQKMLAVRLERIAASDSHNPTKRKMRI
jgi:hypothetical protein